MSTRVVNARIESTFLGVEGHGIFTAYLRLSYGGIQQSFGGYFLNGSACALFVKRVLEVVGTHEWEKLPGKYCRIERVDSTPRRIGNILDEDLWFSPGDEIPRLHDEPESDQ